MPPKVITKIGPHNPNQASKYASKKPDPFAAALEGDENAVLGTNNIRKEMRQQRLAEKRKIKEDVMAGKTARTSGGNAGGVSEVNDSEDINNNANKKISESGPKESTESEKNDNHSQVMNEGDHNSVEKRNSENSNNTEQDYAWMVNDQPEVQPEEPEQLQEQPEQQEQPADQPQPAETNDKDDDDYQSDSEDSENPEDLAQSLASKCKDKNVILFGDGNFGFAASIAPLVCSVGGHITATVLEKDKEDFLNHYKAYENTKNNLEILEDLEYRSSSNCDGQYKEQGYPAAEISPIDGQATIPKSDGGGSCKIRYGIDATKPNEELLQPREGTTGTIFIWNNPYPKQVSDWGANGQDNANNNSSGSGGPGGSGSGPKQSSIVKDIEWTNDIFQKFFNIILDFGATCYYQYKMQLVTFEEERKANSCNKKYMKLFSKTLPKNSPSNPFAGKPFCIEIWLTMPMKNYARCGLEQIIDVSCANNGNKWSSWVQWKEGEQQKYIEDKVTRQLGNGSVPESESAEDTFAYAYHPGCRLKLTDVKGFDKDKFLHYADGVHGDDRDMRVNRYTGELITKPNYYSQACGTFVYSVLPKTDRRVHRLLTNYYQDKSLQGINDARRLNKGGKKGKGKGDKDSGGYGKDSGGYGGKDSGYGKDNSYGKDYGKDSKGYGKDSGQYGKDSKGYGKDSKGYSNGKDSYYDSYTNGPATKRQRHDSRDDHYGYYNSNSGGGGGSSYNDYHGGSGSGYNDYYDKGYGKGGGGGGKW